MIKTYSKKPLAWHVAGALAWLASAPMMAADWGDLTPEHPQAVRNANVTTPGDYGAVQGVFNKVPLDHNALAFEGNQPFTVNHGVKATLEVDTGTNKRGAATFIHAQNFTTLNLKGDIDITGIETNAATSQMQEGGVNLLYASYGSTMNVGEAGKTTKVWAFSKGGDALSPKAGSTIQVLSTKNQMVGSLDMLGLAQPGSNLFDKLFKQLQYLGQFSSLNMTLDGEDSYWFGDVRNGDTGYMLHGGGAKTESLVKGAMNVKLQNGAQWSYLSDEGRFYEKKAYGFLGYQALPKMASKFTLENGGTININDTDLKATWAKLGIADKHPWMKEPINHDYVVIREVDGDGGIFKMDIQASDRKKSDLVVISNFSGKHFIDVADPNGLEGITESTPLLFAMTGGDGTFAAKTEKLATPVTNVDLKIEKLDSLARPTEDQTMIDRIEKAELFTQGLSPWYITTMSFRPTPNVTGVTNVGRSYMNLFMPYESLDTRYGCEVEASQDSRPWVRIWGTTDKYKDEHFKTDATRVAVGWSHPMSEHHRLGAMIEGTMASTRFDDQAYTKARAHGVSVALTDLYDRHDWYVDSKLEAGWLKQKATHSSDSALGFNWSQWGWGGSVEAGVRFKNENGFFVTPQIQVAARYLPSHSVNLAGVTVRHDKSIYATTREGLRLGMAYPDYSISAHVDFLQRWGKFGDVAYTDRYTTHRASWAGSKNWIEVGLNGHWRVTPKHQLALRVGGEIDKARSQAFFGMLEWSYRY